MKKIISFLFGICILLSLIPMEARAESGTLYSYEDFWYQLNDNNHAVICLYEGNATELEIPSTIDGHEVTSIMSSAFSYCSKLESVTIPDTVTSIGDSAFKGCNSLESITLSSGLTSIDDATFYDCSSLTSITLPSGITSIGDSAFRGCVSLGSITILGNVTSIGDSAFYSCSSLTSITIPSSVTSIGDSAFYSCSKLGSIIIPSSVTSIGESVFSYCNRLESVTIPGSVTSIGERAFSYCSSLESIKIPDSVTSIGKNAFYFCKNLSGITIPSTVISIEDKTFAYCINLESVTIPNSVTSIGSSAFSSCGSLESVFIPKGVTSIAADAFIDSGVKVINGESGSYAETYANDNGYEFVAQQVTPETTATPKPEPLAAPEFTIANVAGGVQIQWDFVEGATGYIVYRREAGGVFAKIAGFTDGVTKSYVDKNVVDGTAYFYAVKAINSTAQSTYTTKGINYKVALVAPQFTIENVAGGVQIKWDFVEGATGYIVYRREAGGVFQKIAGYTDGVTKSYVDTNVVDGTAYFYAVKAISSSAQSTYTTKGINYKAALAAPQFTIVNTAGGVQIKWDFVEGATGYIVYRREAGGVFKKIAGYTDGVTKSYVDTNVVNGTAYFYAVKAINSSAQSTYTTKGINYKAALSAPQFTVANVTDGVQVKWDFVEGATGYIVYRREANGVFAKIAGFTDGVTKSYVDTTAESGTTYYYAVKAINSTKQSTYNSVEITP